MKFKFVLSVLIAAFLFACNNGADKNGTTSTANANSSTKDSANFTELQWIDSTKDLGKINEGQKVEVAFRFKNSGDKPLVIQNVQPGCGCTVAETPTEPIAPGKEGVIKGVFDSNGRVGPNHKTIYVTANTKPSQQHVVSFTVEVIKKETK